MDEFKEKLESYKLPIGLILVGIVLIVVGLFVNPQKTPEFPKESILKTTSNYIKADISGSVLSPGVYELEEGSRVEDLIKKAGGLRSDVNQEFVAKNINRAQKITDGAKYYIPKVGEAVGASNGFIAGSSVVGVQTEIININTSSQKDLEGLPGIGPVTASNIIQNRPFSAIEDLINKKIVNKGTFEKIKGSIVAN